MEIKDLDSTRIPNHVAIIMDGNGRWAKQKGKTRIFGHKNGVKAVRDTIECATEMGIKYVTLYAFSTENWNRPKIEVNSLMDLLVVTINNEIKTLMDNNIALKAIGDIDSLPGHTRKELQSAIDKTSKNKKMNLVLALSYSSKWEILNAVKKIAQKVKKGEMAIDDIDEKVFSNNLCTAGIPDPELLIRTSGEYRISNFLLWQIAYSELYFTEKLWPDFRREDLCKAVADYQKRERRFGKTSE